MNNKNFILIKVNGTSNHDKNNYIPTSIRRKHIEELIKESDLFKYCGKSRIDGFHMFYLNSLTMRRIKIDKVMNKTNLSERLNKLMDRIKDDIEYVTVYEDCYIKN